MLVGKSKTKGDQVPLPVSTLFSKFNVSENPTISEYISSIPNTITGIASTLLSSRFEEKYNSTDYTLRNRKRICQYIREFHTKAGTLTSRVDDSIGLLNDPSSKILISIHQPNLFAYGGVYKKIVLLETLKDIVMTRDDKANIIPIFLIVDHDFLDDVWIRLAQLPSLRHKGGILEIRTPVSKSMRWQMVCNTAPPPKSVLDSWKKQVIQWIKNATSQNYDRPLLLQNFLNLWTEVEDAHARSTSYADFNAFFQSKVVNNIWNYGTLFVRLSDISAVLNRGFEFLLSNYGRYANAVEAAERYFVQHNINTGVSSTAYLNAPVWIHCRCGSKASAKVLNVGRGIVLNGKCMSCKSDLQIGFDNTEDLKLSDEIVQKFSPRAIPILLLLSRELGIGCYASGTGGSIGYAILGSLIFRDLSIKMPLTAVWPSDDLYTGIGQSEALAYLQLKNKLEVVDYLQKLNIEDSKKSKEIKPLLVERNLLVNRKQAIDTILSRIFLLKEQQRKIHSMIKVGEKVRKSLHIKPCILDYGINFGISNVESQWRQNLIDNDNLMSPCILRLRD